MSNNYVAFAGFSWRIVRINGDGTVRLILDTLASTLSNYHNSNEGYEDLENNTISTFLTTFYDNNLKSYEAYIANAKYCKDGLSNNGKTEKIYNAYSRIVTDMNPTFNCLGDKYSSKIGLITADEVIYAGGLTTSENKDYYLYNSAIENNWWTSNIAKFSSQGFYPFAIDTNGKVVSDINGTLYRGLRPVININKKTVVTGTGTITDPYVIS